MRYLMLIAVLALAGCEDCPPSFKAGELVKHRLEGWSGIVLKNAADIQNMDGYCLVDVRPKGNAAPTGAYATVELERL